MAGRTLLSDATPDSAPAQIGPSRRGDGSLHSVTRAGRDVAWLATIFESIPDGLVAVTTDERIVLLNSAAERILGLTSKAVIGRSLSEVFDSPALAELISAMRLAGDAQLSDGHSRRTFELTAIRADGSRVPLEATASRVQIESNALTTIVLRDVTKQRLLQEELREAHQMETIGRLAGGLAHDFNNLLSAITGYLEFVRPAVADEDALADLDEVTNAAYRAADLARQLLMFSPPIMGPRIGVPNDPVSPIAEGPTSGHHRLADSTGEPNADRARVLVVEDDDVVRALARRLLQRDGHVVTEARTGKEALSRWRERESAGSAIDLVVTDVVMPDMGGRDLVAQLRGLRPGLPIVYMSGYLADTLAGLDLSGPSELLDKPFSAATLRAAVDAVLTSEHDQR